MINQIFALTVKELKVVFKARGSITGLFLLPITFILVMTVALKGSFEAGSSNNPLMFLVVNQDHGAIASQVISDLEGVKGLSLVEQIDNQPVTRMQAEDLITSGKYSLALVFPDSFSECIQASGNSTNPCTATVSFVEDPAIGAQLLSPVKGMVEGYVEREAMSVQMPSKIQTGIRQAASLLPADQGAIIATLGDKLASQISESNGNLGVDYQVMTPEKYKQTITPTSVEENVPGYTIYGVFFIAATIATSLFREKNEGTFRRLQAAPITRGVLLAGKLLPYYLINLIQIVVMFTVGVVVFHLNLGHDYLTLALLSLTVAATATGLGLLLAALTKNQEQASSTGTLLSILLSVVGGMMVPVWVMPKFMQSLAYFTPHAWALKGFQDVIVRGQGLPEVMPAIGALLLFAIVFWGIGLWRYRFE
jgi:ABC-2 type transport system permease protein